jgi:DNA-binding NtrC family response regulator
VASIVIVEDEPVLRAELKRLLVRSGHQAIEAGSVEEAVRAGALACDLVLTDLRLPGASGTDLIARAPGVPVLIMTSYATVKSAVEAMRMGAVDYIAKPLDHDELLLLVDQILAQRRSRRPPDATAAHAEGLGELMGRCPAMHDVFARIRQAAPTDATVLIRGEPGSGKELVARAIHALSGRRAVPLVGVNCVAIPPGLVESELFGRERGAFAGADAARAGLVEAADGGTLFLDEIAELSLPVQGRLLRVLEDGEVRRMGSTESRRARFRLLAATHRDLARMVEAGSLRADLYFRLRVVEIVLPPLRDRGDDIEEIALVLVERLGARLGRPRRTLTPGALKAIRAHRWPGNVRELENALERAIILSDGGEISPEHLGLGALRAVDAAAAAPARDHEEDLSLVAYFRRFVLTHQAHMSESELAAKLGISRKSLWERRLRYSIPRNRSSE